MAFKEAKGRSQRAFYPRKGPRFYDAKVDYKLLKGLGIKVVMYQPWQIGLFQEELKGKFLWYPSAGTLVFESEDGFFVRIGQKGDFVAGGHEARFARANVTEEVFNIITEKVYEQQTYG